MSEDPIIARKDQHLDVVLQGRGRHARDAGFDAVRFVHEALPDLDHAKIDLGADIVGQAAGVLPAATISTEAVISHFQLVVRQLRTACFCTGSSNLQALKRAPLQRQAPAQP